MNKMINTLEYSKQSPRDVITDIRKIIGALSEEESSHPHDEREEVAWREFYEGVKFLDDMNGMKELDRIEVIKARRLEIEYFKKMGVYKKVPRSKVTEMGCKTITTKWLDTNKGDDINPNFRSRLVGREIKKDTRLDLFAATPPLETLKFLASLCARGQKRKNPFRMAVIDIKRAYFYAPAKRPVFIEIPAEDREKGDEDCVGQLALSLYGTRDAAQNWNEEYTNTLNSWGLR